MDPLFCALLEKGYKRIAGVDEVGRGPLAGPVVAAAVILPTNFDIPLADSKSLTPSEREKLYPLILAKAIEVGIGVVPPGMIDRINIRKATLSAMREAVNSFAVPPEIIIVDGVDTIPGLAVKQIAKVKADALVSVVSAASIVAKVFRDRLMTLLGSLFPQYQFQTNKGYPTRKHREAIITYGFTPFHRLSFKGICNII